MNINKIAITSDSFRNDGIFSFGHTVFPFSELRLCEHFSILLQKELERLGVVSVDNFVTSNKKSPVSRHTFVFDIAFPKMPEGSAKAWSTGSVISSGFQTLSHGLTTSQNRWGKVSTNTWADLHPRLLSQQSSFVRVVPFYLDSPDAVILYERLEKLAVAYSDVLYRYFEGVSGLSLRVSRVPLSRKSPQGADSV